MQQSIQSWNKQNILISTDKSLLDISKIHRFLSVEAYWSIGVPKSVVEKAISNSLCFGVYDQSESKKVQVGFARIVSDFASFAWLCDVYIEKSYRGMGLSKFLMTCVTAHPDLQNLRRLCLATKDAHSLYKQFGFKVTESPENWMEIKDNDIYKKLAQKNLK